jgi:hypothetical protein
MCSNRDMAEGSRPAGDAKGLCGRRAALGMLGGVAAAGLAWARAAADPRDPETTLALASTLDQLAEWTPPGDTTAALYRRDATALLLPLQNHPGLQHRVLPLLARQQLTTDPATAFATAAAASSSAGLHHAAAHLAHLQSLFQQSRWEDLATAATRLPQPTGHAESQYFWTGPVR